MYMIKLIPKKGTVMKQSSDAPNPLDPFGTMRAMRDTTLEMWSKMMIDMVNSDAYAQASAKWLDAYLTASQPFQQMIEKTTTQVLTELNMPTRGDIISLAERFTNIEMRLDDIDVRFDEIQSSLQKLSKGEEGR
jgi:hypothetical protein